MLKKISIILTLILFSCWILFCLAVYHFPKYFFYNPSNEKSLIANAIANDFPAQEVKYKSQDGTILYGWYIAPKDKDKVIVFYHGNSFNIEAFYHKLTPFVEKGYGVFIGEYRGFGGIKGEISEKNLANDAVAAVDYLYTQGYSNDKLILYGMSLGSFTSIYTANKLGKTSPFAALILEVPFDSLLNVVKQRIIPLFPFDFIVKDKYDNTALVADIKSPIFIMGASRDRVVPIERAKNLFKLANEPKKMLTYSGASHSSLYNYRNWRDILKWLEANEKTK
ncbi:MAG: hypothetical protein E7020_02670 [Alphaproteobacteria bacterium]|nr:hypothetical protein [Alphaproteobacteria bacterium]